MFNKMSYKIHEKYNDIFNSDWEHIERVESGEIA
jgi:ribosomal protein S17E